MPSSPKRIRIQACHGPAAGHPRSADSQSRPLADDDVFCFSFNKLPNDALQQICALASTRSCPAPCQLALTSKECGEAVTEHVRDAPIELQLGLSRPSSAMAAALATAPKTSILQLTPAAAAAPPNKKQQEAADLAARIQADCTRLFSLSKWLKKNSNQVGTLTITSHAKYASGLDYWQRSLVATGMATVMQGLAAGRAAQGRLRLTAVDLEVLSHSQLQATLDTLSACQRLRRLCLTGPNKLHRSKDGGVLANWKAPAGSTSSSSASAAMVYNARAAYCSSTAFKLGLSLSGMSALTHLQLCTDWLRDEGYYGNGAGTDPSALDIQPLLLKLPPTLQVLRLLGCDRVALSLSSMKHLTQLRHLQLPCLIHMEPPPPGITRASLTAGLLQLSSLACHAVLGDYGEDLLELPGLQHLTGDTCCDLHNPCKPVLNRASLERLAAVPGLRALSLMTTEALPPAGALNGWSPLSMLTHLQHLTLLMPGNNWAHLTYWGCELHALTGLRSLSMAAKVLLIRLSPASCIGSVILQRLTALVKLTLSCKGADDMPVPTGITLPAHLRALLQVPLEATFSMPKHPQGVAGAVLELVRGAAPRLQQLELSWVAQPVAQVVAAAAEQLPGVAVRASEAELDAGA